MLTLAATGHFLGVKVWPGKVRACSCVVLLKDLPSSGVLTSRTHIIYNLCAYFKMRGLGGKRKKNNRKIENSCLESWAVQLNHMHTSCE